MFAFHCDIPQGVTVLYVTFDDVSQPESTASAKLARIKWNRLPVYPPIEFVVDNGSFQETYKVNYHDGERYPHLERDNTKPDVLTEVIKSRAR